MKRSILAFALGFLLATPLGVLVCLFCFIVGVFVGHAF